MFAERVQEAECGYVMNKTAGEDIFKECLYSPASSSKIFRQPWKRPDIFSRSYTFRFRLWVSEDGNKAC